MKGVPDSHPLAQVSIPGTHESCALRVLLNACCQTLSIAEQLNQGIRFLDIRCVNDKNQFSIAHGSADETATFSSVMADCNAFLMANPSECIIVSVDKERDDSNSTQTFEQTFRTYIPGNPWLVNQQGQLATTLPTMGEGRGKLMLFRRFQLDPTSGAQALGGIDATYWPDNQTFTNDNPAQPLAIQDEYQVSKLALIKDKWSEVQAFLIKTDADSTSNTWYINFTSGSSLLAYPSAVAKGSNPITGVNEYLFDYLVNVYPQQEKHVGTVLLDYCEFPDYGLMPAIIAFNRP
jgi:1-phosphatidylinositol phosphodiesterase